MRNNKWRISLCNNPPAKKNRFDAFYFNCSYSCLFVSVAFAENSSSTQMPGERLDCTIRLLSLCIVLGICARVVFRLRKTSIIQYCIMFSKIASALRLKITIHLFVRRSHRSLNFAGMLQGTGHAHCTPAHINVVRREKFTALLFELNSIFVQTVNCLHLPFRDSKRLYS